MTDRKGDNTKKRRRLPELDGVFIPRSERSAQKEGEVAVAAMTQATATRSTTTNYDRKTSGWLFVKSTKLEGVLQQRLAVLEEYTKISRRVIDTVIAVYMRERVTYQKIGSIHGVSKDTRFLLTGKEEDEGKRRLYLLASLGRTKIPDYLTPSPSESVTISYLMMSSAATQWSDLICVPANVNHRAIKKFLAPLHPCMFRIESWIVGDWKLSVKLSDISYRTTIYSCRFEIIGPNEYSDQLEFDIFSRGLTPTQWGFFSFSSHTNNIECYVLDKTTGDFRLQCVLGWVFWIDVIDIVNVAKVKPYLVDSTSLALFSLTPHTIGEISFYTRENDHPESSFTFKTSVYLHASLVRVVDDCYHVIAHRCSSGLEVQVQSCSSGLEVQVFDAHGKLINIIPLQYDSRRVSPSSFVTEEPLLIVTDSVTCQSDILY